MLNELPLTIKIFIIFISITTKAILKINLHIIYKIKFKEKIWENILN
jgi:hypothetical protein